MDSNLLSRLKARLAILPGCYDYAQLLSYSCIMTGKTKDEIRNKMGLATYDEWAKFLNIA